MSELTGDWCGDEFELAPLEPPTVRAGTTRAPNPQTVIAELADAARERLRELERRVTDFRSGRAGTLARAEIAGRVVELRLLISEMLRG